MHATTADKRNSLSLGEPKKKFRTEENNLYMHARVPRTKFLKVLIKAHAS